VTSGRRSLSPRGGPARQSAAVAPWRRGYLEAALGAVAGSVMGGWIGEWAGSILAAGDSSDTLDPAPLFLAIAAGLWLGAVAGGAAALLAARRSLILATAIGILVAWPAMASAAGGVQTLLGWGPTFLPYVVSTLLAGLAARFVVLRVVAGDD
jgi:hypothetical protein